MLMCAEIINGNGAVIVRAERDVSQDNDLIALIQSALGRFQQGYPDRPFLNEVSRSGLFVRLGEANLADA
jgi:hypothetical protein